jgi:hypothetical protein
LAVTEQEQPQETINRNFTLRGPAAKYYQYEGLEALLEGGTRCGKSFAFLIKAKMVADLHPGSRQLICRQTRKSMNESILRDWREEILWTGHPAVSGSASKEHQDIYRWPNKSEVYFAGLENARDTASPILSTKWDRIYVCQAEETSQNDWEVLATRLSSFKTPYHQMTADCNPAGPTHWLNVRFSPGRVGSLKRERFPFRHYDNPFFYKGIYPHGEWTKEGAEYMSILESTLPVGSIRRARFLESKWIAAEGQILDNFDPRIHLIDAQLKGSKETGFYIVPEGNAVAQLGSNPIRVAYFTCGVDFGWSPDPGVISLWAYDSPRWHPLVRRFRVAEVMRVQWQRDQFADVAVEWWNKYGVKYFSCDPSDPENISYFNLRLSKKGYRDAPKIAVKCPPIGGGHRRSKNNTAGIDLMREGLGGANGHVRTFLFRDAFPLGVDEKLRSTGRATCYEQEVESWVYQLDASGNPTEKPSRDTGKHGNAVYAAMYDEMLNYARGFGRDLSAQERPAPDTVDYLIWQDEKDKKAKARRGPRRTPW